MSLENLFKIGQLEQHQTDAKQFGRMLQSSSRALDDARQVTVSAETRLEAAYRAIIQLSMAALWANGYRPSSKGGHHMTMIQSLVHTVDLDIDRMRVLDTFRVKRHGINYSGEDVDIPSAEACAAAAEELMRHVQDWTHENRQDLLY